LIPLKALAYKELCAIEKPSDDDILKIAKHQDDIYRLANALTAKLINLPPQIAADLSWTLDSLQAKILQGGANAELQLEIVEQMRTVFALQ
jgi:hypothetical protein